MLRIPAFCFALALPAAAAADGAALLIGTERYDSFSRVAGADDLMAAQDELEAAGFAVTALRNATAEDLAPALAGFLDAAAEADRLIVALSGQFVTDGTRSWLLPRDAEAPSILAPGAGAVSVESALALLATRPGAALLILGSRAGDDEIDPWLSEGIGAPDIPQGVTLLSGPTWRVADLLEDEIARPGADLIATARGARDIEVTGFAPPSLVLIPEPTEQPEPEGPRVIDTAPEEAAWEAAQEADSLDAYQGFLRDWPNGVFADEAEARVAAILDEPFRTERLAEEALALGRSARRGIQQDLTTLGFNTRGIDGIFGPGTRGAVTNWQQENGFPQSGYLNREQIDRLDAQAARREAELQAQAEREAAEAARLDRAYWEETGARGDESGYRTYLERYPEGLFATLARSRLGEIEAERQAAAEAADRAFWEQSGARGDAAGYRAYLDRYPEGLFAQIARTALGESANDGNAADRAAWDRAVETNSVDGYRRYLSDWPDGQFRAEAEARIAALAGPAIDEAAVAAAQEEERRLNLNPLTARLVEARLADLGLEPGRVDGDFNAATRQAIARYQDARGLPVTGYMSQATAVRLLADAIVIE